MTIVYDKLMALHLASGQIVFGFCEKIADGAARFFSDPETFAMVGWSTGGRMVAVARSSNAVLARFFSARTRRRSRWSDGRRAGGWSRLRDQATRSSRDFSRRGPGDVRDGRMVDGRADGRGCAIKQRGPRRDFTPPVPGSIDGRLCGG
jgi:hypothetical protein